MTGEELRAYQRRLLAKKAELEARLRDRSGLHVERSADPLDDAMAQAGRAEAAEELHRCAEGLSKVKRALEKILQGDFGECESCGEGIAPVRLNIAPWVERCVVCQHEHEIKEK